MKAATLDYTDTVPDDEGRQKVAPVGGWHTVTAMEHPLVGEDKSVHRALAVGSAELRVAVGPQSDAPPSRTLRRLVRGGRPAGTGAGTGPAATTR